MPEFSSMGTIDTFIALPEANSSYSFLNSLLQGGNKVDTKSLPVSYMFKGAPKAPKGDDVIPYVLDEMDKHGVRTGLVDATSSDGLGAKAIQKYPGRFVGIIQLDPNTGMDAVALLKQRVKSEGIVAAGFWPAFVSPQAPINDKKAYPIYTTCSELGIPIFMTTGVPGPRVPMMAQHVELLDEVCWFFPDLKIVMRHGGDPWTDLAVKLLLKWPNLYYSTSAFAPKHYPENIVEFANTRGSDKILYAGYFPVGLSLDRIFAELASVPFKEEVWPKFLSENAKRVLGL